MATSRPHSSPRLLLGRCDWPQGGIYSEDPARFWSQVRVLASWAGPFPVNQILSSWHSSYFSTARIQHHGQGSVYRVYLAFGSRGSEFMVAEWMSPEAESSHPEPQTDSTHKAHPRCPTFSNKAHLHLPKQDHQLGTKYSSAQDLYVTSYSSQHTRCVPTLKPTLYLH